MSIDGVTMAPAVGASDIEWLAAQNGPTLRSPPAALLRRRLSGFRTIAEAVPGAIAQIIVDDEISWEEAAPLQNLIHGRLAILNQAFGWQLPEP